MLIAVGIHDGHEGDLQAPGFRHRVVLALHVHDEHRSRELLHVADAVKVLHLAGMSSNSPLPLVASEDPLSDRETEVLRLIAQGHSNKEIAAQLDISAKTVETYKTRSMRKLGLRGRADIVRYAVSQSWLKE